VGKMKSKIGVKNRFLPIIIALGLMTLMLFIPIMIFIKTGIVKQAYEESLPYIYEECIKQNKSIVYYGDFGYNCTLIKEDYLKLYKKNDGG
jgi:hypothetical protein